MNKAVGTAAAGQVIKDIAEKDMVNEVNN